jgi:hypothetical protein
MSSRVVRVLVLGSTLVASVWFFLEDQPLAGVWLGLFGGLGLIWVFRPPLGLASASENEARGIRILVLAALMGAVGVACLIGWGVQQDNGRGALIVALGVGLALRGADYRFRADRRQEREEAQEREHQERMRRLRDLTPS